SRCTRRRPHHGLSEFSVSPAAAAGEHWRSATRYISMADIFPWTQDRAAFLSAVRRHVPNEVAGYAEILDDLIQWSLRQGEALPFVPRQGRHAVGESSVPGVDVPLWTAPPRQSDGAKLIIFTGPYPAISERVRQLAQLEFARMEGRETCPETQTTISFRALRSERARGRLKELFSYILGWLDGHRSKATSS